MESKGHNYFFAVFQLITGVISIFLVVFAYAKFHKPLQDFFEQLSGGEAVSLQGVFKQVDKIALHIESTVLTHRESVGSISQSTLVATNIIKPWKKGTGELSAILKDTAQVTDTFAQHLPFHLPSVHLENRSITFQVPKVTFQSQEVKIPYPVITEVQKRTEEIRYPKSATVESKTFQIDSARTQSKKKPKSGKIEVAYPSALEVVYDTFSITYPDKIIIGTDNKTITVPDVPEEQLKEYTVNDPHITVEVQQIMLEEKAVLEKISKRLRLVATSLGATPQAFEELQKLLEEARSSLHTTDGHLESVGQSTALLREQLAELVNDLEAQKKDPEQLRKSASALAGFVPLLFIILGLISAATAAGGAAKLYIHRHNKPDKPCQPPIDRNPCQQEQEPQPDNTPQQQPEQHDFPSDKPEDQRT